MLLALTLLNYNCVKYTYLLLPSFWMFSFFNTDKLQLKNCHPVFSYFTVSKIQVPLEEISFVYSILHYFTRKWKPPKSCQNLLIHLVLNNKICSKFYRLPYTSVSCMMTETVLLQTHMLFSSRMKSHWSTCLPPCKRRSWDIHRARRKIVQPKYVLPFEIFSTLLLALITFLHNYVVFWTILNPAWNLKLVSS